MFFQPKREDFDKYIVPCFSPAPFILVKGRGSRLWDQENKEYIDFASGIAVTSLGHSNVKLINALNTQLNKLWHVSNIYTNEPVLKLAKKLVELTFADKVFFCNSGAEANEAALKLARKYANEYYDKTKNEIIAFENSFHGRTLFTVTVGGQSKYSDNFGPLPPAITHLPYNDLKTFEQHISSKTCAVIVELIIGEGGVIPIDPFFLEQVRKICTNYDITLIFDEIQTGMGRTGYLYAYQEYNIVPDILTSAKGLGGGFPIGAMLTKEKWAQIFQPGTHGTTFGGNLLAATVAETVLSQLDYEMLSGVLQRHDIIMNELIKLNKKYNIFQIIRGKGLLIGAQLSSIYYGKAKKLTQLASEEGLLILIAGSNVVRFTPALNIPLDDIYEGFQYFEQAIIRFKDK
ncbi:bifunctional succinylornithine transaminase/acetylornithine transaminase [Candidatus Ishikawella capsulata]|uniref:bifunctional succinylornithine transaminase/acetylornithine transaminase n=1 Tax=Candidatus Ishikawella capsulata TaxID=168169 RepID=UPI0005974900|nr:bifunctional succinylornithine transaminase/acetylornithine transaminase [Candidatus Ishikawaella capsulata]